MIAELLQDVKTEIAKFPWLSLLVALTIVAGIDFKMAIFSEADGNQLRMSTILGPSAEDQMNRLRMKRCSTGLTPGFTVIIGMRQYSMELSVPIDGVRSLLEDTRTDVTGAWCRSSRVA